MALTPEQAAADLRRVADRADELVERELAKTAREAAREIGMRWPRDTGRSAAGWRARGTEVRNDVRYVPFVRDGVSAATIPEEVFGELEDDTVARVDDEVRRTAGWE